MAASVYGIEGSFPGDDAKLAKVAALEEALKAAKAPSVGQVVEVLHDLPASGRLQFTAKALCGSAHRDELVRGLFQWCFEIEGESGTETDDEYVMVGCNTTKFLNASRSYIMSCVVTALAQCGSLCVDLFEMYQKTTSRIYRPALLGCVAKCEAFSDAALLEAYKGSVPAERKELLETCKSVPLRATFLGLLMEEGLVEMHEAIYWATPEVMQAALLAPKATEASRKSVLEHGFSNWRVHGDTYVAYLREVLTGAGHDLLHKGQLYKDFEGKLAASALGSHHIEALVLVCREHNLLEIGTGGEVKGNVADHLRSLSREGKLSLEYRAVQPVCPSKRLVRRIVDRDGFLQALVERNSSNELGVKSGCTGVHRELFLTPIKSRTQKGKRVDSISTVFESVKPETFWLYLLRNHRTGDLPCTPQLDLFHTVVSYVNKVGSERDNNISSSTLNAWVDLHKKHTPSPATLAWAAAEENLNTLASGAQGECFLWSLWMESAVRMFQAVINHALKKALRIRQHTDYAKQRSGLTSYLGYAAVLLERMNDAFAPAHNYYTGLKAGQHRDAAEHTVVSCHLRESHAILMDLDAHLAWLKIDQTCPAVERFRAGMTKLVTETILPSLMRMLPVFDVRHEAYLAKGPTEACKTFLSLMQGRALRVLLERGEAWGSPAVAFAKAFLTSVQLTKEQRSQGFFVGEPGQDGQRSFRHFSQSQHKTLEQKAQNTLEAMLQHLGNSEREDKYAENKQADAVALEAWAVHKHSTLMEEVRSGVTLYAALQESSLDHTAARVAYLSTVAKQRRVVVKAEEAVILTVAEKLLAAGSSQIRHIAGPLRSTRLAEKFYMKHRSLDGVKPHLYTFLKGTSALANDSTGLRECLERDTKGKDMHERMAGHVALMQASSYCLEDTGYPGEADMAPFIRSLDSVTKAIKNEAGLVRPQLYDLVKQESLRIVRATLRQGTDEAAVSAAQSIAKLLERMLKDDVGKRDSVAKNTFRSIGTQVIMEALFSPSSSADDKLAPKRAAARRAWVECGIRLDFIVLRKNTGEQSWKYYVWQAHAQAAQHPRWGTGQVDVAKVLQAAEANYGPPGEQTVRQQSNIEANRDLAHRSPLTRVECAQMLHDALDAVKAHELAEQPSLEFLRTPLAELPAVNAAADDDEAERLARAADSVFSRMEYLVQVCGPQWTECKAVLAFLTRIQQHMTRGRQEGVRKPERVKHLNRSVAFYHQLKSAGVSLYHSELLQRVCYELLAEAVCPEVGQNKIACQLAREWLESHGGRSFSFEGLSSLEVQFLLAHVGGCGHKDRSSTKFKETAATVQTEAVRQLLYEVSPSAIYMEEVRSVVVRRRDDVLGRFIGAQCKDFWGSLRPTPPGEFEKADDIFNIRLDEKDVSLLNGSCSRKYSELSLQLAMVAGTSVNVRAEAVSRYVQSPSTGHEDIVRLLKTLLSNEENSALVESVVLTVFRTDAAWHVLAYLLSPAGLASSAQRTAAQVLKKLCGWAPPASAVRVIQRLLAKDRRGAVRLPLHKNILRELAASEVSEAQTVLLSEWQNRDSYSLHEDLQHEIVRLALEQVNDNTLRRKASEAVWQILREASDPAQCALEEVQLMFTRQRWVPSRRQDLWIAKEPIFSLEGANTVLPRAASRPGKQTTDQEACFFKLQKKRDQVTMRFSCGDAVMFKRHSLTAEDPAHVGHNCGVKRYCELLGGANERISAGAGNPLVGLLATGARFTFDWRGASGHVSDETLESIKQSVMSLKPSAAPEGDIVVLGDLPAPVQYLTARLVSVYMYYVMETLLTQQSCVTTYTDFQRREGFARESVIKSHPAAGHHKAFTRAVLRELLNTPPRHGIMRQFLTVVAKGLVASPCLNAAWRKNLVLEQHKTELDYLRQEASNLSTLI
eukprot:TRINITY_DN7798_c1_g1_i1.p1 TRINITY_DN7798_c1_g1~~TRINITY_DN7798_c1_g1_i1.p1  ORF type:complete len:1905 (+),score=729.26 TRINITY_DN7798_c1_g1_i1:51-5717(+)